MQLKLQKIGNSVGVILPKEELTKRGLQVGDLIAVDLMEDPFWEELKRFTKEDRRAVDNLDDLSDDDFKEWENL